MCCWIKYFFFYEWIFKSWLQKSFFEQKLIPGTFPQPVYCNEDPPWSSGSGGALQRWWWGTRINPGVHALPEQIHPGQGELLGPSSCWALLLFLFWWCISVHSCSNLNSSYITVDFQVWICFSPWSPIMKKWKATEELGQPQPLLSPFGMTGNRKDFGLALRSQRKCCCGCSINAPFINMCTYSNQHEILCGM